MIASKLTDNAVQALSKPGLGPYATRGGDRLGSALFNLPGVHPREVGANLDRAGGAVRAGRQRCQPLMRPLGVAATTKASLYVHEAQADVDSGRLGHSSCRPSMRSFVSP